MTFKNPIRFVVLFAALLVLGSASAYAQGSCTSCTTTNSNLTLSATVQTAIQLAISTGTSGATISGSAGAYTVPFGTVNGLGIGTPAAGVSVVASGTGATYTTPIFVTPSFSGFASTTGTVQVYQDATTTAASQSAAREGGAAGTVAAVPTTSGTATTISSTAASAANITRYVGVFVSNANGGSAVTGSLAPKFIYVVTVP